MKSTQKSLVALGPARIRGSGLGGVENCSRRDVEISSPGAGKAERRKLVTFLEQASC